MISYDNLFKDVKKMLTEQRFTHTIGVVKRAEEYAKIYHVDVNKVKLTALAHDIAKNLSFEENNEFIKKYNIIFDDIEKTSINLWHSKIGAKLCQEKYHFTDDMVMAISYHTTGRENMSMLEKIIYLADATEEGRKHCSKEYVDIIKNDIDKGMVEICKWTINKLLSENVTVHPNTLKCYNYYVKVGSK